MERFAAAVDGAARWPGSTFPHRHLLASGGILAVERLVAGERPVFDGLRVGLAAYGIVPDGLAVGSAAAGIHAGLRPVLSLHARPIRVADLPAGTGISYGPSFVTARPSRIATLPLGYADGWVRSLSNRATALVRGRRVPLVGNVAMDAVMADVTDVPGPPVTSRRRVRPPRCPGRRRDHRPGAGAGAHHDHLGGRRRDVPAAAPGVHCAGRAGRHPYAHRGSGDMAQLALWNGDICDLEVDAIVNPANVTLWMSTGVAGAIKRRGGDAIEFAAVRQAPVALGRRDRDRRRGPRARAGSSTPCRSTTSGARARPRSSGPSGARSSRARELGVETLAIPALGTGVGGFPLAEAARITVAAVRAEAPRLPRLRTITFALRGAAAYEAFRQALATPEAAGAQAGGGRA